MFKTKKTLAVLVSVLALSGCFEDKNDSRQAAQLPEVKVKVLQAENVPLSFEFSARAQGSKDTEVRARVGGILLKRNYVEGSQVDEGQVLFQIDPVPFEVALAQAKAKLA